VTAVEGSSWYGAEPHLDEQQGANPT
jgi:hypothetical protein